MSKGLLREKRLEFLQSIENDRRYYIPLEDYDKFLNDNSINIKDYYNENTFKKQIDRENINRNYKFVQEEKEYIEEMKILDYYYHANKYIDEYNLNENEYFYNDEIFIDEKYSDWKFNSGLDFSEAYIEDL
jgi:hypothetical protein